MSSCGGLISSFLHVLAWSAHAFIWWLDQLVSSLDQLVSRQVLSIHLRQLDQFAPSAWSSLINLAWLPGIVIPSRLSWSACLQLINLSSYLAIFCSFSELIKLILHLLRFHFIGPAHLNSLVFCALSPQKAYNITQSHCMKRALSPLHLQKVTLTTIIGLQEAY